MQIRSRKQLQKKLALGGSWAPFGRGLGRSGASFGRSWVLLGAVGSFLGLSKSSFFQAWVQDELQEAFWIHLESILGGFGEGLGRVLGGIW